MKNNISLITPISKDLLYVKTADAVQEYIKVNGLKPGDRLPSERDLSVKFKTSRHSVREALRVLENQGMIEVLMGSGTYVAETEKASSMYLEFVKVNYLELLHIKTALEKYALELAIDSAKNEQLEQLEKVLEELEQKGNTGVFDYKLDKQFHYTLAELSGNKMLIQMITKMIETLDEYYGILPQTTKMCLETVSWHRCLMDAVKKRDKQAALQACDEILQVDTKLIREAGKPAEANKVRGKENTYERH